MSRLTNYLRDHDTKVGNREIDGQPWLIEVLAVVLHELDKNIKTKEGLLDVLKSSHGTDAAEYRRLVREYGFTEGECAEVLKAMRAERDRVSLERDETLAVDDADSRICGAYCPNEGTKVLDLLAVASPKNDSVFAWALGDFKFELKGDGSNLFCDDGNFRERVVEKFDDVQGLLSSDGECYWKSRMVVVTTAVSKTARSLFERMAVGKRKPLLVKGNYKIVNVGEMLQALQNAKNQFRTYARNGETSACFG